MPDGKEHTKPLKQCFIFYLPFGLGTEEHKNSNSSLAYRVHTRPRCLLLNTQNSEHSGTFTKWDLHKVEARDVRAPV